MWWKNFFIESFKEKFIKYNYETIIMKYNYEAIDKLSCDFDKANTAGCHIKFSCNDNN